MKGYLREIKVKLADGSIVNISVQGDIYQNLADAVGISRVEAKVILWKILYGAKGVETKLGRVFS